MKRSFTLVELMIAVSVLAIGIVLVLRSFLSAATALDISQDNIEAAQFLQAKMSELQEKAKNDAGIETAELTEESAEFLGHKGAVFSKGITAVKETNEEEKTELTGFDEVDLKLSWKQSNRERDVTLCTYMPDRQKKI